MVERDGRGCGDRDRDRFQALAHVAATFASCAHRADPAGPRSKRLPAPREADLKLTDLPSSFLHRAIEFER